MSTVRILKFMNIHFTEQKMKFSMNIQRYTQVALQTCSQKKVSQKYAANLQNNTHADV